jgi:nucleoside-diphosphate-sugar epimerase|tara:strand:+ start:725 stop:1570 length:846 start_codon:yes stop_codon:yes gene_type:complete
MKNILVLGSAGQIGSHLVNFLKKKNYNVSEFDIETNKKEDLRLHNNSFLKKKIAKADYVFFLAFDVGGSRYLQKYQESYQFIKNNLDLMSKTFELLKKYNKKFLFASSQMSNMNYSNYGILKLIGEKISKTTNGLVVKFWNVYGLEKDISKSHVITDFILMAIKNKKIKMLTNGKESRDFLYADDCCEGLEIAMKKHTQFIKQGISIDIASGKEIKIINIAKIIKKIFKKENIDIQIKAKKLKDLIQVNKRNKVNKYFLKFWKPKTSIQDGINSIVHHYKR